MRITPIIAAAAALVPAAAISQSPFASYDIASEAVLNDPHDLEIGPDGLLYVADKLGDRIVVMDPETLEILSTFGDGRLPQARDIDFGPDGRAYVSVSGLSAVAVFDFSSGEPEMVELLRGFPRTEGLLAHSNGRVYVMASGTGHLVAVEDGEVAAAAGGMPGAHGVEEALDGSVWVADNFQRRLVRFSPELEILQVIEGPAFGLVGARYFAVDEFGRLVVADQDAHRVLLIDPVTEELLGVLGDGLPGEGPNKFDDPEGAAVMGNEYFISDSDNNRIVRYVVLTN